MGFELDPSLRQKVRETFQRDLQFVAGLLTTELVSEEWPIDSHSDLARDDEVTATADALSHQVLRLLHAGSDNLHGVSSMLLQAGHIHTYAEYCMIRGGLECAAQAWWLLESESRQERVTRSLKMYWQETKDMGQTFHASDTWPSFQKRRLSKRNYVAHRNGIDPAVLDGGFSMTPILREMTTKTDVHVLSAWRAASGMVHGRLWAMLTLSEHVAVPSRLGRGRQITGDEDSMALVFHTAAIALQDAHDLFHRRRGEIPPSPLGLR